MRRRICGSSRAVHTRKVFRYRRHSKSAIRQSTICSCGERMYIASMSGFISLFSSILSISGLRLAYRHSESLFPTYSRYSRWGCHLLLPHCLLSSWKIHRWPAPSTTKWFSSVDLQSMADLHLLGLLILLCPRLLSSSSVTVWNISITLILTVPLLLDRRHHLGVLQRLDSISCLDFSRYVEIYQF